MSVTAWPEGIRIDLAHMMCGELLGRGISREVYIFVPDPTKVIKIETRSGWYQNVIEWETWRALEDTRYAKYLAPCHHLSDYGTALIQSRIGPLPEKRGRVRLPDFLTDLKDGNYGTLDGRIVCADYGTNLLLNHGAFASRLREPEWIE